ncbi:InlB B-repeat-containing protein [bacterium]|nr:InlB B-repeat-containing protein [bacterium]
MTTPENPTKAGYTFAGWDKTIPTTMPAEDMTITAKWNKNSSGGSSS